MKNLVFRLRTLSLLGSAVHITSYSCSTGAFGHFEGCISRRLCTHSSTSLFRFDGRLQKRAQQMIAYQVLVRSRVRERVPYITSFDFGNKISNCYNAIKYFSLHYCSKLLPGPSDIYSYGTYISLSSRFVSNVSKTSLQRSISTRTTTRRMERRMGTSRSKTSMEKNWTSKCRE